MGRTTKKGRKEGREGERGKKAQRKGGKEAIRADTGAPSTEDWGRKKEEGKKWEAVWMPVYMMVRWAQGESLASNLVPGTPAAWCRLLSELSGHPLAFSPPLLPHEPSFSSSSTGVLLDNSP